MLPTMMLWALALWACSSPDPDALLRAYKLEEAAAVWQEQTGRTLDFGHPGVDGLARRAAHDPTITCAEIERRAAPARLLDQTPLQGRKTLDLSFPSLAPVLEAAFDLGARQVAVGRSKNPHEREVSNGGDLEWTDGRVVGGAETRGAAAALGAHVDAEPPPRLVTIAMTDGLHGEPSWAASRVYFTVQRRDGLWVTINSITPDAAARWINFADYAAGHGVEAARTRYGADPP